MAVSLTFQLVSKSQFPVEEERSSSEDTKWLIPDVSDMVPEDDEDDKNQKRDCAENAPSGHPLGVDSVLRRSQVFTFGVVDL